MGRSAPPPPPTDRLRLPHHHHPGMKALKRVMFPKKASPRFAQNEARKAAVDMTTLLSFQVQPRAPGQPQGRQPPSFSFSSITAATPRCSPRARGGSEESANGKEAPRPRLGRRWGGPFKGAKSLSPASPPGGAVSPKSPGEARAAAASRLPHLSLASPPPRSLLFPSERRRSQAKDGWGLSYLRPGGFPSRAVSEEPVGFITVATVAARALAHLDCREEAAP